jgi:predicted GH43/DUF377 family glycosyl hydrolase
VLAGSLFVLFVCPSLVALTDYESEFSSDIVVESKKIEVPGFPGAFNPSIIRYQGALLLSFRFIPDRKDNMTSYLGLMFLDDDLSPLGEARLINLRRFSQIKSRAEDARLVTVGERLFAVYSDNTDAKITKGGFRVFVIEIWFEDGEMKLGEPECMSDFEGNNPDLREKNWVPFDCEGQLELAYSIEPHLIFLPHLDGSGICETVAKTATTNSWSYGHIRGGTPAFLLDGEYLGFFHSSIRAATKHSDGKEMMHYFMGAYTFQKESPHKLTAISPRPIVGEGFYSGPQFKGYWKPVRAVFPGGYVFDDNNIWVAYGKDDADVWVAKLDRRALMDSLVRLAP